MTLIGLAIGLVLSALVARLMTTLFYGFRPDYIPALVFASFILPTCKDWWMKLRGAVVGCGMISEFHLRGWQRIPEVEIVALVEPVRDRAEERRSQFAPQARLYDTLDGLFADRDAGALDFVDILTPPWLHREHCL